VGKDSVKVELRAPTQADVDLLIANIRHDDKQELEASHGDYQKAIQLSYDKSKYKWAIYAGGEFVCLFGMHPLGLLSDTALIWMLGTDLIEKNKGAFIRHSQEYIKAMLSASPVLTNWCDVRNKKTVRWLKLMGFTFFEAEPYGIKGYPFYRFELRA
jgi:hypothetical protein